MLPREGTVLEVASGSGQHVAAFAVAFPAVVFVPSDPEPAHLASIRAWTRAQPNVRPPLRLDVRERWPMGPMGPIGAVDVVLCVNMIHIAPWSCTERLVQGAARHLRPGGQLVLYGPFRRLGRHTSASNAEFDDSLRARDPSWGVRDLGEVADVAGHAGFTHTHTVTMPANNLSVVFRAAG